MALILLAHQSSSSYLSCTGYLWSDKQLELETVINYLAMTMSYVCYDSDG